MIGIVNSVVFDIHLLNKHSPGVNITINHRMVPGGRNFKNLSNLLIYIETKFGDLKNENLCVELEIANATPELWHQEIGDWTRVGFDPTLRGEGWPCLRKNI